ncbi:hypothetical protein [Petropleomorpha daqingensis]|uniref:AAA domain-containing protein n=1 Tax=Petropleomorpha daqingensis TaxID=2026353 RepID=A0A853C9C6_9ACTN|nr:hypothetical protein [Petropleomorpha daqingensis]NYJ03917.1 hypothetical protein [Petropleomorpha daqingensis]
MGEAVEKVWRINRHMWVGGEPLSGVLDLRGRADPPAAPGPRPGVDRGQVPGPGGTRRPLLDDSTSAEDAPRGVSFLYDLNRLNVAVSRAKALAVVVMSEELLDARGRTPEQLRQVNALCRLVEIATVLAERPGGRLADSFLSLMARRKQTVATL